MNPVIIPVGLPWACWQWNANLGLCGEGTSSTSSTALLLEALGRVDGPGGVDLPLL